jgi:solute carrier family 39 (zinc transporter), member 1/2/3
MPFLKQWGADAEIGPNTCVGMTGNWAVYSWPPAIVLVCVMVIFMMDFVADRYVAAKFGLLHGPESPCPVEDAVTRPEFALDHHKHLHSGDQGDPPSALQQRRDDIEAADKKKSPSSIVPEIGGESVLEDESAAAEVDRSFRQQISAFMVLEFASSSTR